jgi:molecular chaperone GrpE
VAFSTSLLEVADNLSLAIDSIPAEEVESNATLKTFMEGVDMTDKLLSKSFAQHGLTKFGERGDKFDPNLHDALFQLQDPELEEGQIGQVLKAGYQLKERVIRPAQVGTVRK